MNTYISDNLTALYGGGWSTTAITLGYAGTTTAQNNITLGSEVDVTGLTSTVTVPAGGRRIKVTAKVNMVSNGAANKYYVSIKEDNTEIGHQSFYQYADLIASSFEYQSITAIATKVPTAGSHIYKVAVYANPNVTNIVHAATAPNYILVELV